MEIETTAATNFHSWGSVEQALTTAVLIPDYTARSVQKSKFRRAAVCHHHPSANRLVKLSEYGYSWQPPSSTSVSWTGRRQHYQKGWGYKRKRGLSIGCWFNGERCGLNMEQWRVDWSHKHPRPIMRPPWWSVRCGLCDQTLIERWGRHGCYQQIIRFTNVNKRFRQFY